MVPWQESNGEVEGRLGAGSSQGESVVCRAQSRQQEEEELAVMECCAE